MNHSIVLYRTYCNLYTTTHWIYYYLYDIQMRAWQQYLIIISGPSATFYQYNNRTILVL